MDRQEKVISVYQRLADKYDNRYRGYIDQTLSVALEMLQLTGRERLLDVACGTGELERRIVERFPQQPIWGLDLSSAMLEAAREKLAEYASVQFDQGDSRYLPFPDAHFDVVATCSAFHYMREPDRVMREFARVLRPGGRLLVLDWCRDFLFGQLYHLLRKVFFPAHYRVYYLAELEHLMRGAGLEPVTTSTFSVKVVWKMMSVVATKAM